MAQEEEGATQQAKTKNPPHLLVQILAHLLEYKNTNTDTSCNAFGMLKGGAHEAQANMRFQCIMDIVMQVVEHSSRAQGPMH